MISVCHFVNMITGKSDGVFTHLKMIFQSSDKNKYRHILVYQGGEVVEKQLIQLGVPYYKVESLLNKNPFKSFFEFNNIIKTENPDILHVHSLKPYSIAGLLNIFYRKKLIYNYHGLFIDNIYNSTLEKLLYRIAHGLSNIFNSVNLAVVPSNYSKELILKETKLFKEIIVYYNGFLPAKRAVLSDSIILELNNYKKKYFLVGVVARVEIQKRIDKALEILKQLNENGLNVFFAFMGDGPLENEMKNLSIQLGVDERCRFFSYVENVSSYLNYFDLCLFTSDWEGMPSVIWEAMANNVPIVSTDVGGIKEIIESVKCGIVYDKENILEAISLISKLIDEPDKLRIMGQNGKNAIDEKYNLQNFSRTLDNIYKKVIEN